MPLARSTQRPGTQWAIHPLWPGPALANDLPSWPTATKKAAAVAASATDAVSRLADVTDGMHGLLMERADALMGCTENSPEEAELAALTDVIEAYERQPWPDGKIPGGKG